MISCVLLNKFKEITFQLFWWKDRYFKYRHSYSFFWVLKLFKKQTLFPLLPQSPPIEPSLLFFKFMASLSLSVCVCVYIFLNITSSIHKMLFVSMFSGLTIWHWATNWYALPWKYHPLPLPAFFTCLYFFVLNVDFSLHTVPCLWVSLFNSHLRSHVGQTLWEYLLIFLVDKIS